MSNDLHGVKASQFLDFLTGVKHGDILAGATQEQAEAIRQKFLESAQKGVRDQIEITLPLIYLIRPYDIASYVKRGLITENLKSKNLEAPEKPLDYGTDDKSTKRYDKLNTEYTSKKTALSKFIISTKKDGIEYFPGSSEYHDHVHKVVTKLSVSDVGKQIMGQLQDGYNKKITFADLVATATRTLEFIADADNIMAQGIYSEGTDSPGYKAIETKYRQKIQQAGSQQFEWLTKNTPAQFENPESFLSNYSSAKDFLLVTPKFKSSTQGGRDIPNELSRPIIVKALRELNIEGITLTVNEKFSVGAFAAAGHTGATAEEPGSQPMPIGINLPMRQAAYLFATSQSKIIDAQALNPVTFVANTKHLDLSVQFKKDVSGDVKTLFSAMFSIAKTMRASYNSNVLSHQETAFLAHQLDASLGRTYKQIGDAFKENFSSLQGLDQVVNMEFSPSLKESIGMLLMNSISGGKMPKAPRSSSTNTGSKGSEKGTTKTKIKKPGSVQKFNLPKSSPGSSTTAMSMLEQSVPLVPNLISLQNIINSQLQDVISANMGNGSSKNVLNYRTGRFASSVKVEKMSQSRQGMITAYYSYMKNPYATFSDGGKQSIPKSRDPKLLISKSIREIAQELITNQLRAVSV
jgi:hypothetical protein